jgi:23S rRNA (adenine2503-C2)-methyltransferase
MSASERPLPRDARSLEKGELEAILGAMGERGYRARQVFRWLHQRGAAAFEAMTDLPKPLRERLERELGLTSLETDLAQRSTDGTVKYRFKTGDGRFIESVYMPEESRRTLCVSSQVGCAMGCAFCMTGTMGLSRHLTASEIVDQVHRVNAALLAEGAPGPRPLTNLVFMGMGEPLHHYDATRDALAIITDRRGLGLAPSRVRVSTVGLPPRIRQLGSDFGGKVQLAVSLNAGTEATRRQLMPATRRWTLAELKDACADYPLPGKGYVMVEYVLLPGVNDTPAELGGLAAFARGLRCAVNLIPFNPFEGSPFLSPEGPAIVAAHRFLRDRGVAVKVRRPRGRGVGAACGQLALRHAAAADDAPRAPNR